MKLKIFPAGTLLIVALSVIISMPPATAIVGGSSALGNTAVVRLVNVNANAVCSGALWTSRIVVTAAHCVDDSSGQVTTGVIKVFAPGVDTSLNSQFVTQSAIVTVDGWTNVGNTSQPDDIAFLVMPAAIVGGTIARLATTAEVDAFGRDGRLVRFLGYGRTVPTGSSVSSPNYIDQNMTTRVSWPGSFSATQTDTTGTCFGDSGGPIITQVGNEVVLIGIHSAASGPCTASSLPSTTSFVPSAFPALVKRALELANVSALPTVSTADVSGLTFSSATFNGLASSGSLLATTSFTYGLQQALDGDNKTVEAQRVSGTSLVAVSALVTSLIPGSIYFYRANATNLVGTSSGEIRSFRTLGAAPLVTSGTASATSSDSATVSGDFNAQLVDTKAFFQYATVSDFTQVAGTVPAGDVSGSDNATFATKLSSLKPGRTYYWRAAATNAAGTTVGETRSFIAPTFRTQTSLAVDVLSRRLAINTTATQPALIEVVASSRATCVSLNKSTRLKFLKIGNCRIKMTRFEESGKQVNFFNLAVQ